MTENPANVSTTLAHRLMEGKIPVSEALRYAMILAESLRKLHDEGKAHGAVAPCNIGMTAAGVELLAPRLTPTSTCYASPEVLDGRPADVRSDVFSFGALLYHMLTGRAPYQGKDRTSPLPTGSLAVDRLLTGCLPLDPAARSPRMQKVMLDLKLLAVAAARAGAPTAARQNAVSGTALRAEMEQIEARLVARIQAQEKKSAELMKVASEALNHGAEGGDDIHTAMLQMEARIAGRLQAMDKKVAEIQRTAAEALHREPAETGVEAADLQEIETRMMARLQASEQAMAEMQRVATEAVATLRGQLASVGSQLAAAQERAARAEQSIEAAGERVVSRVQHSIDAVTDRIARLEDKVAAFERRGPGAEGERIHAVEQGLDALRKQTAELHDLVAEDMLSFEHSLKSQATAIESARTAMSQTDDLVERVVEALESLQSTVLDHSEERAVAVN